MPAEPIPESEMTPEVLDSLLDFVPDLMADPQSTGRWHKIPAADQSSPTDLY